MIGFMKSYSDVIVWNDLTMTLKLLCNKCEIHVSLIKETKNQNKRWILCSRYVRFTLKFKEENI